MQLQKQHLTTSLLRHKWIKFSAGIVARDKNLLQEFEQDLLLFTGLKLNKGCNSCFDKQYNDFINKLKEVKMKDYILKKMFDGISYKGVIYNNADLTEKQAKFLISKHPHGVKLFDKVAEVKPKKKVVKKSE